jgi:hypothetical protein
MLLNYGGRLATAIATNALVMLSFNLRSRVETSDAISKRSR